ncbi:MAG: hypothetical protein PHY92_03415 [Alphaproteobacteria bacterium]|nr:hypothetical protein [Alphaproteobacteria bacterium]
MAVALDLRYPAKREFILERQFLADLHSEQKTFLPILGQLHDTVFEMTQRPDSPVVVAKRREIETRIVTINLEAPHHSTTIVTYMTSDVVLVHYKAVSIPMILGEITFPKDIRGFKWLGQRRCKDISRVMAGRERPIAVHIICPEFLRSLSCWLNSSVSVIKRATLSVRPPLRRRTKNANCAYGNPD